MTQRARAKGRKPTARQAQAIAEEKAQRLYGSMAMRPGPRPAWDLDRSLLPKRPPARRQEEP